MSTQEKLEVQLLAKEEGRSRFYKKKMHPNVGFNKIGGSFHGRVGQTHGSPKIEKIVGHVVAEPNDRVVIEISNEDVVRLSRIANGIQGLKKIDTGVKVKKQRYRVYDHVVPLSTGAMTSVGAGIAVFTTMPSMSVLAIGAAVVAAVVGYTLTDEMPDE